MELSLDRWWTALGRLAAIFSGSLVVVLGLLSDVPLLAACGRGAVAFFAVRVLTWLGAWAIAWTRAFDPHAVEAAVVAEATARTESTEEAPR